MNKKIRIPHRDDNLHKRQIVKDVNEVVETDNRIEYESTLIKLRESEERYRTLFESAKDGILILNAGTGMIVDVNPFLINLLGYSKEEFKGKKIWEIGTFSDIMANGEKFLELQVKKYIRYDDLPLKARDGRLISVEFVSNVYKANHKNVIQCNIRDITMRKESEFILNQNRLKIESQNIEYLRLNKELIEANKELMLLKEKAEENDRLKTSFLQNMSHEILTPMNGILGFSELLKNPMLSGETQQEYIRIIEQSGNRMLNIISDLINISKIEAGQVVLSIQETNVNQVLKYLFEFFKPEAEERGLNLNFKAEFPDDFFTVETDKTKLTQVLSNLLYNALKFTKTGSISFGYILKENMLEFFVQDTGIGIEPEMYETIFERFRQLDMSVSRNFEGSGLGLAISKAFVNKLGGRIWLKSEPGKGSCFYFTIPHNLEKIDRVEKMKETGLRY